MNISEDDLALAEEYAKTLSLEDVRRVSNKNQIQTDAFAYSQFQILEQVVKIHENDQNFPVTVLEKMEEFLGNEDVFAHPENHEKLIHEMKVEAALIYNNRWV